MTHIHADTQGFDESLSAAVERGIFIVKAAQPGPSDQMLLNPVLWEQIEQLPLHPKPKRQATIGYAISILLSLASNVALPRGIPCHRIEHGSRNCPSLAHRRKKLKGWQKTKR